MGDYHLSILRPPGYLHSDCFLEVREGLFYALQALGHGVSCGENTLRQGATTVLFGAHLLNEAEALSLEPSTVLYNLEQWTDERLPRWYRSMASRVRLWEYSRAQIGAWQGPFPGPPPLLVPIGYVPQLQRIAPAAVQDIDVLFYGSMTPRREAVLLDLVRRGVQVRTHFPLYGAARDGMIARAKVVLNLHARELPVFEVVRVSYLLANAKAVVCEESCDLDDLRNAVAVAAYDVLAERCLDLVRDESARAELERRAHTVFAQRPQVELLRRALELEEQ